MVSQSIFFLLFDVLHVTDILHHLVRKVIEIMMKLLIAYGMGSGVLQEVLGSFHRFLLC